MLDLENLKASTVLQAMATGLLKSKDDSDLIVTMRTYGEVKNSLCYGCCATVALAEMFGKGRSVSELMFGYVKAPADRLKCTNAPLSNFIQLKPSSNQDSFPIDLRNLEAAVDNARLGNVSELIHFLTGEISESFNCRWKISNLNWEEQLPIVEETIAEMIAAGY